MDWGTFLEKFLKSGGTIEASAPGGEAEVANVVISLRLDFDGRINLIGTYDQV